MQRQLLRILIAASMALAPFAFAHTDQGGPGSPDFTCQTAPEWQVHDYVAANGRTVADISDNNLEECGTTYGLFIAGTPECREIEDRLGSGPGNLAWELFCNTDRPADYDGDLEFAIGGALLAVESGDGVDSGSLVCLGTVGHHSANILVQDQVFGTNVAFTIGADASLVPPVPGEPDCGDNVTRPCGPPNSGFGEVVDTVLAVLQTGTCNPNDHLATCIGSCTVPFGAGADGTYTVWVHPTLGASDGGTPTGAVLGHVRTDGVQITAECSDGSDNDGDGLADFPFDPDCSGPFDNDEESAGAPLGQINIHRFPGQTVGYRLITSPPGWTCVDVNGGAAVSAGSPLLGPNPGVRCMAPGLNVCNSVTVGGAHSGVGSGTILATSECASLQANQPLTLPANAGTATSASPALQPFPWTCRVNDVGASADSDYWIFCRVNH